jgi:hypothetical protein
MIRDQQLSREPHHRSQRAPRRRDSARRSSVQGRLSRSTSRASSRSLGRQVVRFRAPLNRAPVGRCATPGAPRPPAARPPKAVTFLNGRDGDICNWWTQPLWALRLFLRNTAAARRPTGSDSGSIWVTVDLKAAISISMTSGKTVAGSTRKRLGRLKKPRARISAQPRTAYLSSSQHSAAAARVISPSCTSSTSPLLTPSISTVKSMSA